jgi:YVTN family beta-propeller protein
MSRAAFTVRSLTVVAVLLATLNLWAQHPPVNRGNWGTVSAPVYGTSESGVYAGAELFAGPNKFGSYFSGVLPNGRIVKPAGQTIQIGMNPLGAALTPDGKYLITSNDDEREGGLASYKSATNKGGYSLSVIDTSTMTVVSQFSTGRYFIGLQATGSGPYTIWAAGGPDNDVKLFTLTAGTLAAGSPSHIVIAPVTPNNAGYVSNYTPDAALNTANGSGFKPPVPSGFSRTGTTQITFPAGMALSPDGKYLYVACNGDNSVAVIDTTAKAVVKQVSVGYFPYGVSVSADGSKVLVSNWGVTEYKFDSPTYDPVTHKLLAIGTSGNQPDGFYVPVTSTGGANPKSSSVSVLNAPGGNGSQLSLIGSVSQGGALDELYKVGGTHPSGTAVIHRNGLEVLFVTKANSDSLGAILLSSNQRLEDVDLSLSQFRLNDEEHHVHGAYPNAIVASPSNDRLYVAEAGLNSVAVLDTSNPTHPELIGRIPTNWYPTALAISPDGNTLYVMNAKGIGEDINPNNPKTGNPPPTGLASDPSTDSNYIFGSLQKVNLSNVSLNNSDVLKYNFAIQARPKGPQIVPVGGDEGSEKVKHVFFILHENKTFDSMLGNVGSHFGPYSSLTYNNFNGTPYTNVQFTGVSLNTQLIAKTFATAVNYYSDSEESDAGHQFAASGTASDYTEKTLLVKSGRGLLVNKNFEPEDYPESGYIFNNAARNGVSFKDYGALVRIEGTDTGTNTPTTIDDPTSGNAGFPQVIGTNVTTPVVNLGDTSSPTQGLGQAYFVALPILSILGGDNPSGEARLDRNYPGYNFNISDQRRAREFIQDFDRMVANGTLPKFVYIYQPNDHTGGTQATNIGSSPLQEVADGDVGLGMVIRHIMRSKVYYDSETGEGSAIFMTYDDAQSSLDHIHPHRTPLVVVSPYAKPGYLGKQHYVTASVVKTEELLLGLPPNNLGDLFATDLRDLFQNSYNGITADQLNFNLDPTYVATIEGTKIWSLVAKLDTSAPDRDSRRLGALIRLSVAADDLHKSAAKENRLKSRSYRKQQSELYARALQIVNASAPRDSDD